jgi:hypothetical protein
MDADDVNKLEWHIRRDIALVAAGALVGLAIGEMLGLGFNLVGSSALTIGIILLVVAVRMKR